MLSNKVIMWISIVILSTPLLALTLRLSHISIDNDELSCNTFNEAFEEHDDINSVRQGSALIISPIQGLDWRQGAIMGDDGTLLRGHHQLTPAWIGECFTRLVGHYQPHHLLIVLNSASFEQSNARLLTDLDFIVHERARYKLPMTISFVGALKTLAEKNKSNAIESNNQAIKLWASERPNVRFVDPNPRFANIYRDPKPTLFWPDGQTLSGRGKQVLYSIISEEIEATSVEPWLDELSFNHDE